MDTLPEELILRITEFIDINDCERFTESTLLSKDTFDFVNNKRSGRVDRVPSGKQLQNLIINDEFDLIEAYTIKFGDRHDMRTSMIMYAITNDFPKYLKFFIEFYKISINDMNSFSDKASSNIPFSTFLRDATMLSYVIFYDSEKCLKYLINIGVDVNYTDHDNLHPLVFALRYLSNKCINLLLRCNRTRKDVIGINLHDGPLYNNILHRMLNITSGEMLDNIIYTIRNYDMYDMLDSTNQENLLVQAIRVGNIGLINYLTEYGVSYPVENVPVDIMGDDIIHQAVLNRNEYPELFSRVIANGRYYLETKNRSYRTPLSILIRDCTLDDLKTFVDAQEAWCKEDTSCKDSLCTKHLWANYECSNYDNKSLKCVISDNDMFIAFMYQTNIEVLEYIIKRKTTIIRSCPTIKDTIMDVISAREKTHEDNTSELIDIFIEKINSEDTPSSEILRDLVEKYILI